MANITLKGNEIHTNGSLPSVGNEAPNFTLVANDLSEKSLNDYKGQRLILNIFPSIDTGVCATSTRKFNETAAQLENTKVLCVSNDLPFALNRFCAAEGIDNVETLSGFRSDFGNQYGIVIEDSALKGLLSRAVVVLDENGKIVYSEQVPEITQEPNYEEAIKSLK